jgi:hypothetical protein
MTAVSIQGGDVASWGPLAASQTGEALPVKPGGLALSAVAVTGTFGGTVFFEGSLDGVNWFSLRDTRNNLIELTSAALVELSTGVAYVRPRTGTGVVAATVKVTLAS